MTRDLLADYRVVLDTLAPEFASVTPADLDRPTPCSEWLVAHVAGHVLDAIAYYAALARTGAVDQRAPMVPVTATDDLPARFAAAAADGLAAWSAPGALTTPVTMRLGEMPGADALAIHVADLAVHAWDLGTALGRTVTLPDEVADACSATWDAVFAAHPLRGVVFAAPAPVPPTASATERLVALCGRPVS